MSQEDQELLEKISKISGHINLHKIQATPTQHDPNGGLASPRPWNRYTQASSHNLIVAPWKSPRVAPYSRGRGRAGRIVANPHRNRTLVLNNKPGPSLFSAKEFSPDSTPSSTKAVQSEDEDPIPLQSTNHWVTKRDRHVQLINSSVYDKETQARNKAIEQTRRQKALQKDRREKQKIERHLDALTSRVGQATNDVAHELSINGLRFHVADGGSKLVRIRGENHDSGTQVFPRSQLPGATDSARSTPKQANVGGATFLRSKNGNLYRSGIVKAKRATGNFKKIAEPCKRFTLTGQCPKGPRCPYIHDPLKVAMCKDYLQTGTCPAGNSCDLSHDHTPERVPACLHFLRGKCSNPSCRYAHVRVNPSASVCKDFAIFGYCSKGANCSERHVHECPDYANAGVCRKPKCHLPHVDRAGQIRKHAANIADRSNGSEEDDDSDIVSDDDYNEIDSDDVDSDGLEEDVMQLIDDTASHTLSQQQDFVQF